MLDDTRLDGKLQDLTRELMSRSMVPGYAITDAFTTSGLDETGKLGIFAAILLAPKPAPELGTISDFRQALAQRLRQIDTRTPGWPIVVQGAPEVLDEGTEVPGGREYFEQVKAELTARRDRLISMRPRHEVLASTPSVPTPLHGSEGSQPRTVAMPKPPRAKTELPSAGRKVAKRTAARTAKPGKRTRTIKRAGTSRRTARR
jgi:hypothetical protein